MKQKGTIMKKSPANTDNDVNAVRMRRRALERWENEGGSTSTYEPPPARTPTAAAPSALEPERAELSGARQPSPAVYYISQMTRLAASPP